MIGRQSELLGIFIVDDVLPDSCLCFTVGAVFESIGYQSMQGKRQIQFIMTYTLQNLQQKMETHPAT